MEDNIIKRDCFAYVSDNYYIGCKALKNLCCKNEDCKFYKQKKLKKYIEGEEK